MFKLFRDQTDFDDDKAAFIKKYPIVDEVRVIFQINVKLIFTSCFGSGAQQFNVCESDQRTNVSFPWIMIAGLNAYQLLLVIFR